MSLHTGKNTRQKLDPADAILFKNIENKIAVFGMLKNDVLLELPL